MLNYSCLHFSDLDAEELFDILALRQEVFIVEQMCIYRDADAIDKNCWHVLGQDYEDRLIAYARISCDEVQNGETLVIGRVATSPKIRRTGEGKILMNNTIEFAYNLFGRKPVRVSAQTYSKHFYLNLGFEVRGEPYLEDGIPHIEMILNP